MIWRWHMEMWDDVGSGISISWFSTRSQIKSLWMSKISGTVKKEFWVKEAVKPGPKVIMTLGCLLFFGGEFVTKKNKAMRSWLFEKRPHDSTYFYIYIYIHINLYITVLKGILTTHSRQGLQAEFRKTSPTVGISPNWIYIGSRFV